MPLRCFDAKSLPRLRSEYPKRSSFPGAWNHSENATTSFATVEREQIRTNCSLYSEKHSPGGPTLVLIQKIFYHHTLPSKGMNVPFHDRAFRFVSWKASGQTFFRQKASIKSLVNDIIIKLISNPHH